MVWKIYSLKNILLKNGRHYTPAHDDSTPYLDKPMNYFNKVFFNSGVLSISTIIFQHAERNGSK
ncbi:hypothetical protein, partial [Pluralibacter gergoviae]|uniref:hypothetical protein n=1 Tax=Pluralibacter gergoviae TaxID=61647 RepID=UPI0039F07CCD